MLICWGIRVSAIELQYKFPYNSSNYETCIEFLPAKAAIAFSAF